MIYLGRNPVGITDVVYVVPIDDTAGIGDTDKVWSADKLATDDSALRSSLQSSLESLTGDDYKLILGDALTPQATQSNNS